METIVCNASNEKIQDVPLSNNPEKKGQLFSPVNLSMPMEKTEVQTDGDSKGLEARSPLCMTDAPIQKSQSPTLIEHAFNVVKNIFSPDKNRSRPPSVLTSMSQQRCSSGSPRNSVFISGKSDYDDSEASVESPNQAGGIIAESCLKGDSIRADQLGYFSNNSNQDSHNNTNDSFLTTVSLIEESFQSAVTHLEDNGDRLNDDVDSIDLYMNTQNLDILDSINNTLCGSEHGLENTMLKNSSYLSVGGQLENISDNSEDGSAALINSSVNEKNNLPGAKQNTPSIHCQEDDTTFMASLAKTVSDESAISEQIVDKPDKNTMILENNESVKCEKLTEIIKMADASLNKTIDKCLTNLSTSLNDIESTNKACETTILEKEVCESESMNSLVSNPESIIKTLNEGTKSEVESSISTTTIVLSETDSDLENALSALKLTEDEENSPPEFQGGVENTGPKLIKEFSPFKTPKSVNDANISKNSESEEKLIKKGTWSSTNTPNKSVKGNRNNLNKSVDSVTRKNHYNSPKGKKSFRQKPTEEFVGNLSKENVTTESFNICFFPTESVGSQKTGDKPLEIKEGGDKTNPTSSVENCLSFTQSSLPLSSQQSYTILNTSDTSLKRPVINSYEDINLTSSRSLSDAFSFPEPNNLEVKKTLSDPTNDCSMGPNDSECKAPVSKQSTPELKMTSENKGMSVSKDNLPRLRSLSPCYPEDKIQVSHRIPTPEFSPVVPVEGDVYHYVHSVEKQLISTSSPRRTTPLRNSCVTPVKDLKEKEIINKSMELQTSKKLNQTFDKKPPTPDVKNQTFEVKEKPLEEKANETFEVKPGAQANIERMNETFDIKGNIQTSEKMNETFDLKSVTPEQSKLNGTYDLKSGVQETDKMNKTFDLKAGLLESNQMNQTFDKKQCSLNQTFDVKPQKLLVEEDPKQAIEEKTENKMNVEFNMRKEIESIELKQVPEDKGNQMKSCPVTITDPNFLKSDLMGPPVDNRESFNSSFISTTSSNTSLLCNGNLTVVMNQGGADIQKSQEDDTTGEMDEWSDTFSRPSSANQVCQPDFAESKSNSFPKEEKLQCDPDLVQFIQEQFTSTDIEKICSVVDDFSIVKRSFQTPKAPTLLGTPNRDDHPIEGANEKFINPLSPHSFDFLSSIGGKPTGRDWSRESLYVKFDPLVQGPGANSLIDFTKEVEALETLEASPRNETVVEHLLTISPEKKPDEIVPPLTPFSQRSKNAAKEDKSERLKELQNEIYFLKNLYAEREKINKNKMDEFETQITKLTGQTCMLEDKLKESNEREKSLVRKLHEQKQTIDQLKLIMEEYVKVITKLTSELENLKNENQKQVETLNAEKESYVTHLQNTEAAFTDVHAKYEKSKKTIVSLKSNETLFRQTLADQMQKMEEYKEKAREAQERAYKDMQKLQEELKEIKSNHSQESTRLRAQLRKTELKLEAMQESLDQKIKENQELTAICDDLIAGKK